MLSPAHYPCSGTNFLLGYFIPLAFLFSIYAQYFFYITALLRIFNNSNFCDFFAMFHLCYSSQLVMQNYAATLQAQTIYLRSASAIEYPLTFKKYKWIYFSLNKYSFSLNITCFLQKLSAKNCIKSTYTYLHKVHGMSLATWSVLLATF